MKKVLFILLALSFSCKVVCSANALTSIEERVFPVIETFVTETDTAEHITLIKDLKIDPHNPTENVEIFLRSHLMTNSS